MPPTTGIHLHCSPHGCRAGLAMASSGGRRLTLIVLPKTWRGTRGRWRIVANNQGVDRTLIAYEGDYLQLPRADENLAELLVRAATDEAQVREVRHRDLITNKDDDKAERLAALVSRVGGPPQRVVAGKKQAWTPVPYDPESAEASDEQLLALALLCHRLKRQELEGIEHVVESGVGGLFTVATTAHASSPVFELLRAWQYVRDVERRVREVRQGYREEEEWLTKPRGRILPRGIVRQQASGQARLLCQHDEFTPSTPLFQLVVTALDALSAGAGTRGLLARSRLAKEVRRQAQRVRVELAHIPSAPAVSVVASCRYLRLGRLLEAWEPVRAMAIDILQHRPAEHASAPEGADGALLWTVDTSKVWERVIERGLAQVERHRSAPMKYTADIDRGLSTADVDWRCEDPWQQGAAYDKWPDFLVYCPGLPFERWVMDAKYKLRKPTEVDRGDRFQMFVYSHLTRIAGKPPQRAAIIRPAWAHGQLPGKPLDRNGPGEKLQMDVIELAFPTAAQVMSVEGWRMALGEVAEGLEEALGRNTA